MFALVRRRGLVLLHPVRADHLAVPDRAGEPGGDRLHPYDHPVRVAVQLGLVRCGRVLARNPLGEQRHHVVARRGQRVVEHARDADVGERPARRLPAHRLLEGLLDVVQAFREHDRPAVDLRVEFGMAGEHRQPAQRQVDLDGAAAALPAADVGQERLGQRPRLHQLAERDLRVQRRDHDTGVHLLTGRQSHPGHLAARRGPDPGHRGAGTDFRAQRASRAGQGAGHPTTTSRRELTICLSLAGRREGGR
jgi:hypothetical protein